MFLLGGRYAAAIVNEKWDVEILIFLDIRDSVGELSVSRREMVLRTSLEVPPYACSAGWSALYVL